MTTEMKVIDATTDQEDVAFLFRQRDLTSAPVVDSGGRLVGVITIDDVVDVIDEEHEDDIMRLGGVSEDDLYSAALETARSRFTWLLVNLGTAILASIVIGLFDATIEHMVALAVLMPIVASMGGNAGTQTLTVAVRALATKELTEANAWRVVGKELLVGGINGVLFAVITGLIAWLWFDSAGLALVIGMAMVANLIVAGLSGALIPLALERMKIDPAVASAVFLTTVTDVVGFFAFLGLGAWLLL
jgi:magnesium transporter